MEQVINYPGYFSCTLLLHIWLIENWLPHPPYLYDKETLNRTVCSKETASWVEGILQKVSTALRTVSDCSSKVYSKKYLSSYLKTTLIPHIKVTRLWDFSHVGPAPNHILTLGKILNFCVRSALNEYVPSKTRSSNTWLLGGVAVLEELHL